MTHTSAADRVAMQIALLQAREAEEAGEVPVGAIVTRDGVTIATAQNRMRRDGDATAHAEIQALRAAAAVVGQPQLNDCTLYVTLEPCAMCAGAIVLARIGRLVFGAWDDKAGMCGSVGDIVRHSKLNHAPEVLAGVEAAASAAMLREFFAVRRKLAQTIPEGL
ncbi:MAG: tRNA adenosine(34) deaminase TadA [Gemmatimonadaceae bacterium]